MFLKNSKTSVQLSNSSSPIKNFLRNKPSVFMSHSEPTLGIKGKWHISPIEVAFVTQYKLTFDIILGGAIFCKSQNFWWSQVRHCDCATRMVKFRRK